jgi:hypothetical protein
MSNDLVLFQQFTDIEAAEDFAAELRNNGIEYHLVDHDNDINVKIYNYNTIQIPIGVNIRQQDFTRADEILTKYYEAQVNNIDRSYYLFSATDAELKVIVKNPYDWGRLDFLLARHILTERGVSITDEDIQQIKEQKLEELTQKKHVSQLLITMGYLLSVLSPLAAAYFSKPRQGDGVLALPVAPIILGLSIYYNRKLLPNGQRFYIHPDKDRAHAKNIIIISVVATIIYLTYHILR